MSDKTFEEYKQQAGWDRVYGPKRFNNNSPEEKEQTEEEILAGVRQILGG